MGNQQQSSSFPPVIIALTLVATLGGLLIIAVLIASFLMKLFGKKKGLLWSVLLWFVAGTLLYLFLLKGENILSESLANSVKGFTISSALVGCVIGGSLGGYIGQNIGRRNGLLLAAILFLVSALGFSFYLEKMGAISLVFMLTYTAFQSWIFLLDLWPEGYPNWLVRAQACSRDQGKNP